MAIQLKHNESASSSESLSPRLLETAQVRDLVAHLIPLLRISNASYWSSMDIELAGKRIRFIAYTQELQRLGTQPPPRAPSTQQRINELQEATESLERTFVTVKNNKEYDEKKRANVARRARRATSNH